MGFADQHEVVLVCDGRRDRFFFRYTEMKVASDAEE
jgi:hypothetical protein